MKNKEGFTLVEMLICIVIIVIVGIVVGISANKLTSTTADAQNIRNMENILKAANIYSNLSTSSCVNQTSCEVTIENLIAIGEIDKTILNKKNPMYENKNFQLNDTVYITIDLKKQIYYSCIGNSATYIIYYDEIDTYEDWGKCQ